MKFVSFLILSLCLCLANAGTESDLILRDSANDLNLKKFYQKQDAKLSKNSLFLKLLGEQRTAGTCQEKYEDACNTGGSSGTGSSACWNKCNSEGYSSSTCASKCGTN